MRHQMQFTAALSPFPNPQDTVISLWLLKNPGQDLLVISQGAYFFKDGSKTALQNNRFHGSMFTQMLFPERKGLYVHSIYRDIIPQKYHLLHFSWWLTHVPVLQQQGTTCKLFRTLLNEHLTVLQKLKNHIKNWRKPCSMFGNCLLH